MSQSSDPLMRHAFLVIECTIPPDITIAEWQRRRAATRRQGSWRAVRARARGRNGG